MNLPSLGRGPCGRALQRSSESGRIVFDAAADGATRLRIIAAGDSAARAAGSAATPPCLRGVRGVLTDIDDTLTTDGAIPMGVRGGARRAA